MTTNDTESTPEPKVLIIDNDGEDALLVDVLYIYTIRVGWLYVEMVLTHPACLNSSKRRNYNMHSLI